MIPPGANGVTLNKFITIIGIPLLFFGYTRIYADSVQLLFLLIVISITFASCLLTKFAQRQNITGNHGTIYSILWINAGVIYGAAIAWNHFFRKEILENHYTGDVFRQIYWNYWAPLYGHTETPSLFDVILIAVLSASLYFAVKIYKNNPAKKDVVKILVLLAVFNLILMIAFALSQNDVRLFQNIYDYKSFGTDGDLALFSNLHDVWGKWNSVMSGLHGRNPHYPPGNLFILKIEQIYGVPGLLKILVITTTLLCIPLLYVLGKTLGFSHENALLVVALFATSASPTIFPTTSTAPATMFFFLASCLGFIFAIKNNNLKGAFLCGLTLAVYSLASFSVFIVGLSIFIISLTYFYLDKEHRFNTIKASVVAGITFLGSLFLVYILTGFNLWLCLMQSIQHNSNIMTADPFDTPVRYLLRSTGNILAYSIYSGIVLASLAIAGYFNLSKAALDLRIFITACLASLLAAGFAGLFFMETERIWVFFTPFLAISAGWGILSYSNSNNRLDIAKLLVITNLLTTSVQEVCFKHYWD